MKWLIICHLASYPKWLIWWRQKLCQNCRIPELLWGLSYLLLNLHFLFHALQLPNAAEVLRFPSVAMATVTTTVALMTGRDPEIWQVEVFDHSVWILKEEVHKFILKLCLCFCLLLLVRFCHARTVIKGVLTLFWTNERIIVVFTYVVLLLKGISPCNMREWLNWQSLALDSMDNPDTS